MIKQAGFLTEEETLSITSTSCIPIYANQETHQAVPYPPLGLHIEL